MREVTRRYLDPLDLLWTQTARAIGFRVSRSSDAFATTDGQGALIIGTHETLDPDDCLAQMILHELCHSLVEGEASLREPDWGLANESDRDLSREHACLRLQAHLLTPLGLRQVFAPTTEHRAFYDTLGEALEGDDKAAELARDGAKRVDSRPWGPHLRHALEASAIIVKASLTLGAPDDALHAFFDR